MKGINQLLCFLACFVCTVAATAQETPVRFINGNFIPSGNVRKQHFQLADIATGEFNEHYFVLVQFDALPSKALQQKLGAAGMHLQTYYPGNAYEAVVKNGFDFSSAKNYNISSIDVVPAFYKIEKKLEAFRQPGSKAQQQGIAVRYSIQVDHQVAKAVLQKAGAKIITQKFGSAGIILIQFDAALIPVLANLPFVNSLSLQPLDDTPLNYRSRATHGVSGLNASQGLNLNGKGVVVGIGDNADASTHIDFTGRLINRSPATAQNHGTHTAGTTGGAGLINPMHRGVAAKATVINQYFSDIIVNAPTYIADYNMRLSNNSYHSADNGCDGERNYNILSVYADQQLSNYTQLMHVFASGNDGTLSCSPYPSFFGTVKSGWQCAKNVLTVGAMRVDNYAIAGFSSRGPAADGRLKPEITASGYDVLSTIANNAYGLNSGTSMACPQVTGALTLMYERFRQKYPNSTASGALMKAIVCNTAEDLGNAGPDFSFGFGMLNARRAIEAIDSGRFITSSIANGASNNHSITIPANTRRVKIMLYWADVAAADNAAVALVNDLDLSVTTPAGAVRRPLILNSTPANVNAAATEGADHLNNIEQVTIENPAAGSYTIQVNAFAIPAGVQEYVVTYEVIANSVALEYPAGGETMLPGDTETIRWAGFGNETNTYTLQYSVNNGASWSTIDNNVAGSRRSYTWTVPSVVTNTALVRISRNGTGFTDQSKLSFRILGQPQVTATSVCEGAVQLKWGLIPGADSYDILMLKGDSMALIDNINDTSYLITGLDKNKTYWFGAAAKTGSTAGRRSVAVSIQPNSGTCALAAFANDLKVDSILEPNTARQFFSNAADAGKPVKISIKNNSIAAISGPYTVSYSYGNGPIVSETVNNTINAGATFNYVFTGTYPTIPSGSQYNFRAWVTKAGDNISNNDTAYKTVKFINNDAITSLPLLEGFETMPAIETQSAEMALGGNQHLDFRSNRTRGRLRTFVNSGFALEGNQALTLDQAPYNSATTTDSATFSYNLSNYVGKQIRFDFYYKNHGQPNLPNNKVWIRGSENNTWIQAYNLFDNQGDVGQWKKALINVNEILSGATPPQNISATFQIRLGQQGNYSTNNPDPVVDIDDGYTFDKLALAEAINDVSAVTIIGPDQSGCGLTASSPISIKIKNHNNVPLSNVQVSYRINNGSVVTETIASIAANQTLDYVFNRLPNFSAYIDYNIGVWVNYPTDNYRSNDSILNYTIHNSPIIASYPYLESFENGDGYFYSNGTNSTWEWGQPAKTLINKAANGKKIWTTNLNGNYADNETSFLYTPCFDLTGLRSPVLSFSHLFDIEQDYDYTWVEYSTDGKTWNKLGYPNGGTNWYDNATLANWRISKTKWHVASIDIPLINSTVKFRFVFSSDGGVTQEGVAIDDVRVHEKSLIPDAAVPASALTAVVSGNSWVPFNSGDSVAGPWYVIAEVNSNGQNLGAVMITPYSDTSASIRSSNGNYYASRNYVVRTANSATGPVKLRLYLTDTEANNLMNATGCTGCQALNDPYELAITRYHGAFAEEDSSMQNNRFGLYQFIPADSASIIPHSNGYYAEFTVQNFGECWFSKGNIMPPSSSVCAGNTITYTAASGGSIFQWQLNTGNGFVNISDDLQYNGTGTATLKITDAPTSFSGYQYRCVVDGVNGPANQLRFANYWAGTISTDWFTAANWSCEQVPDGNTDVIIPGGVAKYPVVDRSTAIRSILIQPGAPVIINTGVNLDVRGK